MCITEKDPCRGAVYLIVLWDHTYLVSVLLLFCYPYILLHFKYFLLLVDCHVTSEQLLKVISYLCRMSVQKASVVERVSAVANSGDRVTKANDGFSLVGKALIVDSRSALVAYLKCHYFLSRCGWRLRNLEGLGL